jgi:Co/Zn/Cd efflux system component
VAHEHHHGHTCGHGHAKARQIDAAFAYLAASALGAIAFSIQLWGSHESRSSGLLGDSFHLLGDIWFNIVSGIALFRAAPKGEPGRGPGLMLIVTGVASMGFGIVKLFDPHIDDAYLMLTTSSAGLALNLGMFVILHFWVGDAHTHAHGHEHHDANLKHILADTVSSVFVVMCAAGLFFFPATTFLVYGDALIGIGIGIVLFGQGWKKFAR